MFDLIKLSADDMRLAQLAADMETVRWRTAKTVTSHSARKIGVMGEIAAVKYITGLHGQRSTVPQGINHRLGLTQNVAKDRGDILLITRRKGVDTVTAMEVKATGNREVRYTIEKHFADNYVADGVNRILLVHIDQTNSLAVECTIDEDVNPKDIVLDWRIAVLDNREVYVSPRRNYVGALQYVD